MPTNSLKSLIKEKDVQFIDLRFTDLLGKWHHMTYQVAMLDEVLEGVCFDGSSIAGWQPINESDMLLMPVLDGAFVDPFVAQPTLVLFCDICFPNGQSYDRDPRYVAKKVQKYLKKTGIADEIHCGPEAEFFIFDDVRFSSGSYESFFALDSGELPTRSGTKEEGGNMGHRPRIGGGYFPVGPVDSGQDIRSEMLSMLMETGVSVEKHHHEVGSAQHEIGIKYAPPVPMGDSMQIYKYVVHNVAHSFGKTATFMPKPVYGDNGTGMHVHQSLWKGGKNLFAGSSYAGLSQDCLYYIGGILKHARVLNAFTNPTTNSYKRLVPGYEAPVILAYSSRNRSASCRIPHASSDGGRRIEMRFPDPSANCYLAFSAMLMAGLDGIMNKIDPGEPMEEDLYHLPDGGKSLPSVASSLEQACEELDKNRSFLLKGDVFSDALIDSYIALREEEIARVKQSPHPVEFDLYYSV